jgi:hypothetical protein
MSWSKLLTDGKLCKTKSLDRKTCHNVKDRVLFDELLINRIN